MIFFYQLLLTLYHQDIFPVCSGYYCLTAAARASCFLRKCSYIRNKKQQQQQKLMTQILVFCSFPGNETSPESFLLHNALARKPKRIRTAFSPSQLLRLEHAFEKNHYVVGAERKQLAHSLSLTETQVRKRHILLVISPGRSSCYFSF